MSATGVDFFRKYGIDGFIILFFVYNFKNSRTKDKHGSFVRPHGHLWKTVSLVGRLRMTACHFTTISFIWRNFENLFVGIISTVLNNQNNVNPIVFGCIWLVWFLQRKNNVWHPVSLAQESTEEKFPWLQLRKQVLQKMGSLVYRISKSKVDFQTFCCVEREKMVQDVEKIQHWKHSQGWRNSCTHGGWLFHTCMWMFYINFFRFFVTSRKKTWGKLMYIWNT